MKKFIVLLRGINVSGKKKIKMSDLKLLFKELSFTNVKTYIQSGNVIFSRKSTNKKTIRKNIEDKIENTFTYDVQVIIKTPSEFDSAIRNNPFLKSKKNDTDRIYFTFLSEIPSTSNITKLREADYSPEEYIIDGNIIYIFCPNGYGQTKLNNNFIEKKLNVYEKTRNFNTVKMLLALPQQHQH